MILMASKVKVAKAGVVAFTLFVEFLAGAYLILYDINLKTYAIYHWYGMAAYTGVNLLLLLAVAATRSRGAVTGAAVWSVLGVILMLGDAFLGLPFSQFSSTTGFSSSAISNGVGYKYLFGFGNGGGSVLYTSVAFSILLVFSLMTAVTALSARKKSA